MELVSLSSANDAMVILERIGRDQVFAGRPALLAALSHGDPRIVASALRAWGALTPRTGEESRAIWATLQRSDERVLIAALQCIGTLADARPTPAVVELLAHPKRNVANDARRCLSRIFGFDVGSDPQPWLDELTKRQERFMPTLDLLRDATASGNDAQVIQTMSDVVAMPDIQIEVIELILPLLDDGSQPVADAAADALYTLRPGEYPRPGSASGLGVAQAGVNPYVVRSLGDGLSAAVPAGTDAATGSVAANRAAAKATADPVVVDVGGSFPWGVTTILAAALAGFALWARAQRTPARAPSPGARSDKPAKKGPTFTS
ncbi:MAG: hypothetical protein H0W72_13415 [Planctomycetes bacterium]|nr:hypothetical protein [Planctomycetota bacterium]